MKNFTSILQFQKEFNTDEKCRKYLEEQRWGGTPACPFCGSTNVHRFATNHKIFKCREKECRKKFSATVGTIYENCKIPLTKFFLATYILSVHSKGISSLQLATWLGVTHKTSWFLTHRIREMLKEKDTEAFNDVVEIDETYIGGVESNKHKSRRTVKGGVGNKAMVIGAAQRSNGKVITKVIDKTNIDNVENFIKENVQENATMYTDEHHAYNRVGKNYKHEKVKHREKEYVRGAVHTNRIEGYWNILKKQIDGIHHFVSPKHLQRYCNESSFRYNNRGLAQDERFATSIKQCEGRLKYNQLIAKNNG